MIADVELILKVCGAGSYLHIGCTESTLVFDLLKRSMDAYGIDESIDVVNKNNQRAPNRFFHGTLAQYPFKPATFDTIIIGSDLLRFNNDDFTKALEFLSRLAKRNVVLYFQPEIIGMFSPHRAESNRLFWEKAFIDAGFRRHPRGMQAIPYHEHENETIGKFTFFECIPEAAQQQFSLAWLAQNRDLHMDMLREPGRRSDGHVSRYVLAASCIRPGDTVLDAACGLGYGTAVMAASSPGAQFIGVDIDSESVAYANSNFASTNPAISYKACDVTQLSFIPDHSIDTVVSFETIEHVENYEIFLAEIKRVLKPDGRFIGSVPNLWCDETGNDPNPYHFHVFDWDKLKEAVNKHFIVDRRWAQTAGGGFKLWNKGREMQSIPLDQAYHSDTEWWIISACANPLGCENIPFTNQFTKNENSDLPALINFGKYYDNPWIYRVMVQLGERLTERNVLLDFCVKIANGSKVGSADQGAALCVIAYQMLESGYVTFETMNALVTAINKFDENYDRNNLHAYRWAISLHYVAGRLLLLFGNREEALNAFITCAEMDPAIFSPLLATKTISARMYAGIIQTANGNIDEAHKHFSTGIKEGHRVIQGDWKNILGNIDNPFPFGLPEAAEVLDVASQCAQALHALERHKSSPGYFWERINLRRFGLVEWNKSLENENALLWKIINKVPA